MNAGAYGGEVKDVLTSVRVMTEEGEIMELPAEELGLGYRTSIIPEKRYIVLGCCDFAYRRQKRRNKSADG